MADQTDVSQSKGFFGNMWDSITGVASAGVGAVKSGVSAVSNAVVPSDASSNVVSNIPQNAASLPPGTQVAAARYNRSVKKLKKETIKLMNVIEGKTRKSHKKSTKKAGAKSRKGRIAKSRKH